MSDPDRPDARAPVGPSVRAIPEGDDRERLMCPDCGFVQYDNPRIVTGVVATWEGRILLCRRAIAPRIGFWTLPAGYLELSETVADGARREAWEKARAQIEIDALLAVYDVPRISQVHMFFRARLTEAAIEPGPESQEVDLFAWPDIPWDDLAFPSVRWALHHFREVAGMAEFAPRTNPEGESGDMHAS